MKKQKLPEPKEVEKFPPPSKLGAKQCPNCKTGEHLTLVAKTLGPKAIFVEITCNRCFRTAISEVESFLGGALRGSIKRWNSKWPDVAYFLDGPSEGIVDDI